MSAVASIEDHALAVTGKKIGGVHVHLVKANGGLQSNALSTVGEQPGFQGTTIIEPPYVLDTLQLLFEYSNSLRQNVDSYATNIDAFGHRFEPVFDIETKRGDEQIKRALTVQRLKADPEADPDPTDEEVAAMKKKIRGLMYVELDRLKSFFDYSCREMSFVAHRRQTTQDKETTGNSFWEVVRTLDGDLARWKLLPPQTMRLMPLDKNPVQTTEVVATGAFGDTEKVPVSVFFRRFVQSYNGRRVFFKEFGDPRTISARTGKIYKNPGTLKKAEGDDFLAATEVLHFKIHSSRSAYGIPRWVGTLLEVLGSRAAAEVNFLYFENKSIPPLALLVSGGRLAANSVDSLKDFINNEIKGRHNFHNILVIEAESAGGAGGENGRMKIELKPLTSAQNSDALFQNYDRANGEKVGGSFRLPAIVRGETRDFNRATADAALGFAEMQVFQPEREEFDWTMNRKVLPDLGIKFWKFKSNSPITRDPETMSEIIRKLVNANILTPAEGRRLANDIFNVTFDELSEPWTQQPMALTLAETTAGAGAQPGGGPPAPDAAQPPQGAAQQPFAPRKVETEEEHAEKVRRQAAGIIELRDRLRELEQKQATETFHSVASAGNEDAPEQKVVTLRVPASLLKSWVIPDEEDATEGDADDEQEKSLPDDARKVAEAKAKKTGKPVYCAVRGGDVKMTFKAPAGGSYHVVRGAGKVTFVPKRK